MASLESPFRIEPTRLLSLDEELSDLTVRIARAATRLGEALHSGTAASLADLVRTMNCYYSNLIEGHRTRPRDIEAALDQQFEADEGRRLLQLEARAHIRVQKLIDGQFSEGTLGEPASSEFLRWVHREFYRDAPEAMLRMSPALLMQPGEFRSQSDEDNAVGRHQPPSSAVVEAFMTHFEQQYRFEAMGDAQMIVSMALAHHRLTYIHPFPDGNGRVSRLMAHAMALKAGIGSNGLWSISRGLARGLQRGAEYKAMLDYADTPRRNDYDGRGNLSLEASVAFTKWFLQVAFDQVTFMASCFSFDNLSERLARYLRRRPELHPESHALLQQVLLRGTLARGAAARATMLKERAARSVLAALLRDGILTSDTPKGPVRLQFKATSAPDLFPRLFDPE